MKRHVKPHHEFQAVQHKKDLGQHFLYDTELLRSLAQKARIPGECSVLEIGAGAGTLTRVLCETASHVTAVEVDEALIPALKRMEREYQNLTVVVSDIRKLNLNELSLGGSFIVIGNIPYSITSQIFELFWGKGYPIRQMSVMVQKEVADKLTATPGDKAFGLMSVRCGYYCTAEIIAKVPASAFTPPPKVDSAFVKLTFREAPPEPVLDERLFWRIVYAGYRLRRKTLLNALKTVLPFPVEALQDIVRNTNLPATIRGEALSVEQWVALSNAITLRSRPSPASEIR
ncbi:MAG: ribosomal RNA small subunit methyltransferase A [Clostridiales bacterium]|nr:ribosomal RNA small subunit methyltransferase A [Clostridiales bacterium]